jgi:hypothetical protein
MIEILVGRAELILSKRNYSYLSSIYNFIAKTFPAAETPLSVLALLE